LLGAPSQQGDPTVIHLRDIAQLLADHGVAGEVVMLFNQLAVALPLGADRFDQADFEPFKEILFGQLRDAESGGA